MVLDIFFRTFNLIMPLASRFSRLRLPYNHPSPISSFLDQSNCYNSWASNMVSLIQLLESRAFSDLPNYRIWGLDSSLIDGLFLRSYTLVTHISLLLIFQQNLMEGPSPSKVEVLNRFLFQTNLILIVFLKLADKIMLSFQGFLCCVLELLSLTIIFSPL